MSKKIEKSLRTPSAPMRLGDEDLAAVSGAKKGGHPAWFVGSPISNTQTNVSGPIIQIAVGNTGDVTQVAAVQQGNSVSF